MFWQLTQIPIRTDGRIKMPCLRNSHADEKNNKYIIKFNIMAYNDQNTAGMVFLQVS